MVPPAPGTFSTTTWADIDSVKGGTSSRASTSGAEPAGKGTTRRMGLPE
jgi:hypothetical protein